MFGKKKKESKIEEGKTGGNFFDAVEEELDEEEDADEGRELAELENQPEWIDEEAEEGQLSVDVYQQGEKIVVKSTIAGVEPEDVDVSLTNDMLTIRGTRRMDQTKSDKHYFFQECYWGAFSRSIILPVEVDAKKIDASIKNGILTVTLPILKSTKDKKKIKVKDEDV